MPRKTWLTLFFPGLVLPALVLALFIEPDLIPDLIIGVACMIPIAACLLAAYRFPGVIERFPRLLVTSIFLLCSAAEIWFLASYGDDLLPSGASTGGRHPVDATGGYLAAWTALVLSLFAIAGAWFMIADALDRWRKARRAAGGANPASRPVRRDAAAGRRSRRRR